MASQPIKSSGYGPAGVLLADAAGRCTFSDPRWDEIAGARPGDALGEGWLEFVHPGDRDRVRAEWRRAVQQASPCCSSFRMGARDGQPRSVQLSSAPIRSAAGSVTAYLATVEDAREPPKNAADSLQSQKMEAVGRLASGLAHDFANLLTLIAGYSEILVARIGDNDPIRPELEEIRKAATRGSSLTAQLLSFSRRHEGELQTIDVNAVVTQMHSMLARVIGEHIQLENRLEPGLHGIQAVPGQIEQVIMNLALNARDAMPRGGRILIETANVEVGRDLPHPDLAPGPHVMLKVSDNGSGMDAQTMRKLFEPFFTTKEEGRGTGLGLATVFAAVRQSRGAIWADSKPGEGATFTIYLPRTEASRAPEAEPAAPRVAGTASETILLVEDEGSVRRLLKHLLAARGYKVVEACDGIEALALYRTLDTPVDLLLTDIVMPRMSGCELSDRLHELKPDLKVIFMSGYKDDVLARAGALRPGTTFLQKPLRPELLENKLREVLDGRRAAQCAPAN